ncbi:MAG: hypothetical protein WBW92_11705 [Rhodanobacteraceae bacterium]
MGIVALAHRSQRSLGRIRLLFIALPLAGFLAGLLAGRPYWVLYVGGVLGQLLYMLIALPMGPLLPFGIAVLLVYTLLFLAAALVGCAARKVIVRADTSREAE